ncbi:MAG: hypothetical protein FJ288_01970, partial [Planctomycetes bacterium]|nr:hypothetical protein [Planctomycetota bacterium]
MAMASLGVGADKRKPLRSACLLIILLASAAILGAMLSRLCESMVVGRRAHAFASESMAAGGVGHSVAVPAAATAAAAPPVPAPAPLAATAAADDGREQTPEEREVLMRGAELARDFEADRQLRRAAELLGAKPPQYRDAATLLQALIDRAGDALASENGLVYCSARRLAERMLAAAGPAALEAYRMEADPQAKAILGPPAAARDEDVLRAVAQRFFLSSYGDDATYLLGCLALDRHDYSAARRHFNRLLSDHPDPDVPKGQVLLRLAIACHRSGDAAAGREAWKRLQESGPGGVSREALAAVEAELTKAPAAVGTDAEDVSAEGAARVRGPPSGAFEAPRALCVPAWSAALPLISTSLPANVNMVIAQDGGAAVFGGAGKAAEERYRQRLLGQWQQGAFFPPGGVLFKDGAAFVKVQSSLVCLDMADGRVRWQSEPRAEESRQGDSAAAIQIRHQIMVMAMMQGRTDGLVPEDQSGRAMRIIGDAIYHIEDPQLWRLGLSGNAQVRVVVGGVRGQDQKQPAGNCLVACDARTGRQVWRQGRTLDEEADPLGAVQFLAPPIRCAGRLLAPVERKGDLYLAALDPATGRMQWQTYLCSYIISRFDVCRNVALAAHGSDVYVLPGQGFVFAVDGADGAVHWASRYERSWAEKAASSAIGPLMPKGWRENAIFADGARLVAMPTDAEAVLVLDAVTGRVVRKVPVADGQYCLGRDGGSLFVGGPAGVRRIDLATGRILWEYGLQGADRACGRGFLAEDAVYVPSGRSVLCLDRQDGGVRATIRMATNEDTPVGNLSCDGQTLFVIGIAEACALTSAAPKLAELGRTLEALDAERRQTLERLAGVEAPLAQVESSRAEVTRSLADAERRLADLGRTKEDLGRQLADLSNLPPAEGARARPAQADFQKRRDELLERVAALGDAIGQVTRSVADLRRRQDDLDKRLAQMKRQQDELQENARTVPHRRAAAFVDRARILMKYERIEEAIRDYQAALGEAPARDNLRADARRELIDAFLLLARREPARAPDILREACAAAESPAEKVRAALAAAEASEAGGDPVRAVETLLPLAKLPSKDPLVDMEAAHGPWRASPRMLAAGGLRHLFAQHGEKVAAHLAPQAQAALAAARDRGGTDALWQVLRLYPGTPAAADAGLEAAAMAEKKGPFEVAEAILREMARSEHPPTAAAGLAALADLHQRQGWLAQAAVEWLRLKEAYPDVPVPVPGPGPRGGSPDPPRSNGTKAAASLAQERLAEKALGAARERLFAGMPEPPWRLLWESKDKSGSAPP